MLAACVLLGMAPRQLSEAFRFVTFEEVQELAAQARQEDLPVPIEGDSPAELGRAWKVWVGRHAARDAERVRRGNEDSVVNLLLFGQSFTNLAKVQEDTLLVHVSQRRGRELLGSSLVQSRLTALSHAIASPGTGGERLRFARDVVGHAGMDPNAADQVSTFLERRLERMLEEYEWYAQADSGGRTTLFRERGLSSDTSVLPNFAVDRTLDAIQNEQVIARVRRAGVIGPGLDFINRRAGFDSYPEQSLQPFAVADSLVELGFSRADDLEIATFDINPRVNAHLTRVRALGDQGTAYELTLALDSTIDWSEALDEYWVQFGRRIGIASELERSSPEGVKARVVSVLPAVAAKLKPFEFNVVLHRPVSTPEPLDLIVVTNVLLYYDGWEQQLALQGMSTLLRPGGLLLSNTPVSPLQATLLELVGFKDVTYSDRRESTDRVAVYRRKPGPSGVR